MLSRWYFIIILSSSVVLHCQNSEPRALDSLDRLHVENLLKKADDFYKTNLDSALFYINKARSLVELYDEQNLTARTLLYKSKYLLYKREYGEIISLLEPNIQNRRFLSDETLGRTYMDIGHAYKQEWVPDSALVNYIKALKCFERSQNRRDISLAYLSFTLIYERIGNEELAQSFANKSMEYATNSKVVEMHEKQLKDIKRYDEYEKSLAFSLDIEKIAKERNDLRLLAVIYSDIKKGYFKLKNYDKALEYSEKELVLREQTKFDALLASKLHFIGDIHLQTANYKKASKYYKDALSKKPSDSLRLSIYKNLKTAYVNLGNTQKALELMESYDILKDSIASRNTKASIAEITSKYNDEQQKQQIKTLSFQNQIKEEKIANQKLTLFGGLAGSGLLLLLGLFMYRSHRAKQSLNYSQLNFKLLQTQLNPHFMFNALNEIKLSINTENREETSDHLVAYSRLMRLILEGSDQEFIELEDDISLISKFLHLQQLVHDSKFNFEVVIDENLDIEMIQIPPMLTQPFVENAVLHGVAEIVEGKIVVSYLKEKDNVIVVIKDNGKGINIGNKHSGKGLHRSMSTNIIDQRIKNYKKLYGYQIQIDTISSENKGTEVKISLPIK